MGLWTKEQISARKGREGQAQLRTEGTSEEGEGHGIRRVTAGELSGDVTGWEETLPRMLIMGTRDS